MPEMLAMRIPIDNYSLFRIEFLLKERDPFTTSFADCWDKQYSSETYLSEHYIHNSKVIFRYDRNIVSLLTWLFNGGKANQEHRYAAAIHSFAQTTEALIEPNIAMYELASTTNSARSICELEIFRRIDNSHPQLFADVAIGRREELEVEFLHKDPIPPVDYIDFEKPLRHWGACYTACLKIAALELSTASSEIKMKQYIDWLEKEFLFIAPAVILANRYFSPNARRQGLLKSLRSPDRERAFSGIRNAAWDLTHVYAWLTDVQKQKDSGKLCILVSLDKGLHSIARSLIISSEDEASFLQAQESEFLNAWGPDSGSRILKAFQSAQQRVMPNGVSSPDRFLSKERASLIMEKLEHELRSFSF